MAMGQMAATLAHEIRNPLGSMELFCTLLKQDLAGQPSSFNLAEQIHRGIRRLDRIISDCLQFSRGATPRMRQLQAVEPLLAEALNYVEPKANEAGVALVSRASGEGPVSCDPHQINQVLLNLLINAVDACIEKESAGDESYLPEVALISDLSSGSDWRLEIRDNGNGISEAHQKLMFDPFYSTKERGTGLGLAIVHSIVAAHEGDILVTSSEGIGTSIEITIRRNSDIAG